MALACVSPAARFNEFGSERILRSRQLNQRLFFKQGLSVGCWGICRRFYNCRVSSVCSPEYGCITVWSEFLTVAVAIRIGASLLLEDLARRKL